MDLAPESVPPQTQSIVGYLVCECGLYSHLQVIPFPSPPPLLQLIHLPVLMAGNAVSSELLASLIGAALHPQLAYVSAPKPAAQRRRSAAPQAPAELHLRGEEDSGRPEHGVACLHPSSVGVRLNASGWASPYVVFDECLATSALFLRDATPIPPLSPLLFSGEHVNAAESPQGGVRLELDGSFAIDVSASVAEVVLEARRQVNARWEEMLREAITGGGGGRFTGQPLLLAIQPLLEVGATPEPTARGDLASARGRARHRKNRAIQPPERKRRKRSRMARYRALYR